MQAPTTLSEYKAQLRKKAAAGELSLHEESLLIELQRNEVAAASDLVRA